MMIQSSFLPPPPPTHTHKLRNLLLLLLAGLAVPAAAQTTVTSSGREGPTACLERQQVNAGNIPITALSTTSVTFTNPTITWNQYVTRLGDIPAPAKAFVTFGVYNADTDSLIGRTFVTLRSGQSFSSRTNSRSGLAAKTPYYLEATVQAQDADDNPVQSIPDQVFARRCFMTGGTYTISANPIASGPTQGSTGCFTISPPHPAGCPQLLVRAQDHPAAVQLHTGQQQLAGHVGMPITARVGNGCGGGRIPGCAETPSTQTGTDIFKMRHYLQGLILS